MPDSLESRVDKLERLFAALTDDQPYETWSARLLEARITYLRVRQDKAVSPSTKALLEKQIERLQKILDERPILIEVTGPDRVIKLENVGRHDRYRATVEPDGTVTLTPAT